MTTILSRPDVACLPRRDQLIHLYRVLARDLEYPSNVKVLGRELGISHDTLYSYARQGSVPPHIAKLIVLRFGEDNVTEEELTRA